MIPGKLYSIKSIELYFDVFRAWLAPPGDNSKAAVSVKNGTVVMCVKSIMGTSHNGNYVWVEYVVLYKNKLLYIEDKLVTFTKIDN